MMDCNFVVKLVRLSIWVYNSRWMDWLLSSIAAIRRWTWSFHPHFFFIYINWCFLTANPSPKYMRVLHTAELAWSYQPVQPTQAPNYWCWVVYCRPAAHLAAAHVVNPVMLDYLYGGGQGTVPARLSVSLSNIHMKACEHALLV